MQSATSCLLLAAILPIAFSTQSAEFNSSYPELITVEPTNSDWKYDDYQLPEQTNSFGDLKYDDYLLPEQNGTYGEYCASSADCDTAHNTFCDTTNSLCRCLPNTAYDGYGRECRPIKCSTYYDNDNSSGPNDCPNGFKCQGSFCTNYCHYNWDSNCRAKPEIYHRWDHTHEIAFYSVLGVIGAFFGIVLLTCLWRRCKRIRCKRVITQHGKTILVADASTPLRGTEIPTKVFSLCYCVPPVTTSTPYVQTYQHGTPLAVPYPYPVMDSKNDYKELPPNYFGPPVTEAPLKTTPTDELLT